MHARKIGAADTVFDGPADGGAKLERIDTGDGTREAHREGLLETRAYLVALLQSLGDHDRLGEVVVGQGHVERQIKADGALPDISREAHDVLIGSEYSVDLRGYIAGG